MNDILKYDKNFNESLFIGNAGNIFSKLHYAVVFKDIDRIRHFVSQNLIDNLENKINSLGSKIQFYDELNISNATIKNFEIVDDKIVIYVSVIIKYLDYIMSDDDKLISGNNRDRVTKEYVLKFEKLIDHEELGIARKCPGCGANMDINNNGKCEYCGTFFDLYKKDYILVSYEQI